MHQQLEGSTNDSSIYAALLIVQVWLLITALESFRAAHREAALLGAVFSGLIFLICLGLYVFVDRVDREVRSSDSVGG